jgi:DNA-binding MarR family transcriptional regulator
MTNSLDLLEPNLLLEAIDSYDYYTPAQRLILQIIVQTSIAGSSKITTSFIAEKAKVSRTAVYKTFKKLIDEGDISFDTHSKTRQRSILLNINSMQKIVSLHLSKQKIKPKV